MEKQRIAEVLRFLPERIRMLVARLVEEEWIDIEEIRLRSGAPLTIGVWGESCFVTQRGGVTNHERVK